MDYNDAHLNHRLAAGQLSTGYTDYTGEPQFDLEVSNVGGGVAWVALDQEAAISLREELDAFIDGRVEATAVDGAALTSFIDEFREYVKNNPQQRFGQALFNAAFQSPDLHNRVEELRATPLDPFYHDDRAEDFLQALFTVKE